MDVFFQFLVSVLSLGGVYALLALGLVVVFGLLGFLNFAHGDLMTLFGYGLFFSKMGGWLLDSFVIKCSSLGGSGGPL